MVLKTFTDEDGDTTQLTFYPDGQLRIQVQHDSGTSGLKSSVNFFPRETAEQIRDALIEAIPLPVVEKPFVETAVEAVPQEFALGELECLPSTSITINIASLTINA